ncbi:MAG: class I SAM-dependent methyltransferase, partial [Thiohalocapsa sp.]
MAAPAPPPASTSAAAGGESERTPAARLEAGLAALGVAATEEQRRQLLGYVHLLVRWNRAYNLTAVREPLDMIPRHVLDSLAVLPWVQRGPVLDVGT